MFFRKLKGALVFYDQQIVCLVAGFVGRQLVVKYYKSFFCPNFIFLNDDDKCSVLKKILPLDMAKKLSMAVRVDVTKALLRRFTVDSAVLEKNLTDFVRSYIKNEMALSPGACLYDFSVVRENKALSKKTVELVVSNKSFCWNVLSRGVFSQKNQFSSFSLVEYDFLASLYDFSKKTKEDSILFLVFYQSGVLGGVVRCGAPVWLHFESFSAGKLSEKFVSAPVFYGDAVSCLAFFKKNCPGVGRVCLVGFPDGFLPPGFLLKMGCVEELSWGRLFLPEKWRVKGCFFRSIEFLMSVSVMRRIFHES